MVIVMREAACEVIHRGLFQHQNDMTRIVGLKFHFILRSFQPSTSKMKIKFVFTALETGRMLDRASLRRLQLIIATTSRKRSPLLRDKFTKSLQVKSVYLVISCKRP